LRPTNLIAEIKNNSHIKKAIFVYTINKEFIRKFDGVMHAQRELNISFISPPPLQRVEWPLPLSEGREGDET
jgi:hypothetical protein